MKIKHENLWDAVKAVFREKFRVLNIYSTERKMKNQ